MTIAALTMAPAVPTGIASAAPDQPATPFAAVLAALGSLPASDRPTTALTAHLLDAPATTCPAETHDGHANGDRDQAPIERDELGALTPVPSDHPGEGGGPVAAGSTPDARVQHCEPGTTSKPAQAPGPTTSPPLADDETTSCRARPSMQSRTRGAPPPWTPAQTRVDEEEVRHLPIRAAVFNERGLLRDVVPSTSTAVAATATAAPTLNTDEAASPLDLSCRARPGIHVSTPPPSAPPARPWTPGQARGDEGRGTGVEVDPPAPLASAVVPQSPLTATPPLASTAGVRQPGIASASLQATMSPAPIIASSRAVRPAAEQPEVPAARPRVLPDREQRLDNTAQAQLNLTPTPDGLHILAAVTRADRDERTRLRDRIASLLSRHGFTLADLRLAGAALPSTKDR